MTWATWTTTRDLDLKFAESSDQTETFWSEMMRYFVVAFQHVWGYLKAAEDESNVQQTTFFHNKASHQCTVLLTVCELRFKFSCPHFGQDWAIEFVCHFRMVYPNRMLGQQLLDAGIVQFAPGSQLDVQKSMGAWGCGRETVIRAWSLFTSWPMTNR